MLALIETKLVAAQKEFQYEMWKMMVVVKDRRDR